MKSILSLTLSMIITFGHITSMAYSYGSNEGFTGIEQFANKRYVIYTNADTNCVELAVIIADDIAHRSVMIERSEQIPPPEGFYVHNDSTKGTDVQPFENLQLSVIKTENPVCVSKWYLSDNKWIQSDTTTGELICNNTTDILFSNIPVIEVFLKSKRTAVTRRYYDGKYYTHSTVDDSTFPSDPVILLSDDGINFDRRIVIDDEEYFYPISKTVYGNGIVIALGSTEIPDLPEFKRWKGYTNFRMYILNENYELLNTVNLNTLRECAGFNDGYFYFYDKAYDIDTTDPQYNTEYYKAYPYHEYFYKSTDGIELVKIPKAEYESAANLISIQENIVLPQYHFATEYDKSTKSMLGFLQHESNDSRYKIEYENGFKGIGCFLNAKSKNWIGILCDEISVAENTKSYLTMDGIYKAVALPMGINYTSNTAIWTNDDYIYIDVDMEKYYRIAIEQSFKNNIIVRLGDKILAFEQPPVLESDRTLVPMRFLFEQMGAAVTWDDATQSATATLNGTAVTFSIDNTTAKVNGADVVMDVPARLINDKTMVPLRFLSEQLGYTVTWDEETNTAIIE